MLGLVGDGFYGQYWGLGFDKETGFGDLYFLCLVLSWVWLGENNNVPPTKFKE